MSEVVVAWGVVMADKPKALFVMLFDVEPEFDAEFNRWFNDEHVPERMGCPGFLRAMRFRADPAPTGAPASSGPVPTYLTIYELESADVMRSPAYQALRAQRSEWTLRMLPKAKQWMRRTFQEVHPERRTGSLLPTACPRRLLMLTLDVSSADEARFNHWYDDDDGLAAINGGPVTSHLARVAAGPGILGAVRFQADTAEKPDATGGAVAPGYLTLYEVAPDHVSRPPAPASDAARAATPPFSIPLRGTYTEMQPERLPTWQR